MHKAALGVNSGNKGHLSRRAQIAYLKANKAFSEMPSEYTDFADVFSPKLVVELLKHMEINNDPIELVDH